MHMQIFYIGFPFSFYTFLFIYLKGYLSLVITKNFYFYKNREQIQLILDKM
jgi:hypothetical protein